MFDIFKKTKEYSLKDLQGTYLGFSPTDESPMAMGELEVTVTENSLKFKSANAHNVEEMEAPISVFSSMTEEEMMQVWEEGSEYIEKSVGFTTPNGMKYVFIPNPGDNEFGLIIRGNELADILGPTILFGPTQVKKGLYEKAVEMIEFGYEKGSFPRVNSNSN